jgi:6-phosphogluconolactonase/glucosamine-6-phosphate isomerase/deaminase
MKLIIKDNYQDLSDLVVNILIGTITQDKRVNLSLTAGATPKLAYEKLAPKLKASSSDFSNAHYYNFDNIGDYEGGLTIQQLNQQLYGPAGIPESNIHPLTIHNYQSWDEQIANDGGLDLMLIGLGADGHFCGNVPETVRYEAMTYHVGLSEWGDAIQEQLKQLFKDLPLPDSSVTMSLKSVLRVRRLVMIVNGESKAKTVKTILGPLDKQWPSSFLQLHPNFTLILDKEAASQL